MLRIGLLGAGFIANIHSNALRYVDGALIAAIGGARPHKCERIAREWEADVCESADELIRREDIDAVDICLPGFLHREWTEKAAANGKHVFCEMPMALTVQDCDAMLAATGEAGVRLMVGQCLRFWPAYQALGRIVASQELGKVEALSMRRNGARPEWSRWYQESCAARELLIYDVDILLWLGGMPRIAAARRVGPKEATRQVFAIYEWQGAQVLTQAAMLPARGLPFRQGFLATFERGAVEYDPSVEPKLRVYPKDAEDYTPELPEPLGIEDGLELNAYVAELQYFADCIRDDKPFIAAPAESARDVVAVVEETVEMRRP